ncbi:Monovalent cation/H+ antiporter subunit D family protein [Sulfidibacter corallicola]
MRQRPRKGVLIAMDTLVMTSQLPLYAVLASALAPIPLILAGRNPNMREAVTFAAGFLKLWFVMKMLPPVLEGKVLEYTLFEPVAGLPVQFRVDGMSMLFALVASSLWILTSAYAIGYMRPLKEHAQTRFYVFFAFSLSATLGVAFAGNLLTLYVFYELLSMSTYPLVTHHQDAEARGGGRRYLTYLLATSVGLVLPAMLFCYLKSGDMTFAAGGFLAGKVTPTEALVLLLMFVFGFAKAGVMPFHGWLPGAMVAPTPVSALLHAVAVVKVGVFCILRVVTGVFGLDFLEQLDLGLVVSFIAGFTVICSSLIALSQDNLKRRLAFSTVGQLSYIILGASLLSDLAVKGSMAHIAMHAFGKITLFFCAGAIYVATKKKYISDMVGIGRRMPITMVCFLIGSMSVMGLPPTGGLISKLHLLLGAPDSGRWWLMLFYVVSTLLNGAYLLPIVFRAFFKTGKHFDAGTEVQEAPMFCLVPLTLTAIGSILLFFFPHLVFELASLMVEGS